MKLGLSVLVLAATSLAAGCATQVTLTRAGGRYLPDRRTASSRC